MNINKFTQNSMLAVQGCEKIADDYGNQEIEQEHLLYSLLTQDGSLILKLMEKLGIQKELLIERVEQALRKRPKVQGGQLYIGQNLNKVLIHAEDEAKQMRDEYVSVEHIFLALLKYANREVKEIFKEFSINRDVYKRQIERIKEENIPHGAIRVAFTPDEEIGTGASHFNVEEFDADFGYTLDGDGEGEIQYENFNACKADFEITGFAVHPGSSKDTMINASLVACLLYTSRCV